jgi:MFS family permease
MHQVGGVLTERVTWRWCFYLNLPIGSVHTQCTHNLLLILSSAVTAVVLIFFLKTRRPPLTSNHKSWRGRTLELDPLGNTLFITAVICLLLALQYGGTTWAWDSGRIVALLMLFGFLMILFGILQLSMGEAATWPKRIASQRSMFFGSIFSFCLGASYLVFAFYMSVAAPTINIVPADFDIVRTTCKLSRATTHYWRASAFSHSFWAKSAET